jgi:hypothetical protein
MMGAALVVVLLGGRAVEACRRVTAPDHDAAEWTAMLAVKEES